MKESRLVVTGLVLILAMASVSGAETGPDAAFLQSLEETVQAPASPQGPSHNGAPAPTPKACSISRPCGDGNTAACTGNSSCIYSAKGVKCDGVETACPNYCAMGWWCECGQRTCSSLRGDCGVTNTGCDGQEKICLCPFFP